tara:strand:+ start:237 stop:677 length:441 start_codon:yes stop_codon:yes gene_type:complete
MRVIETKIYTIKDHPKKENCFNWIRENWHDLNEYNLIELSQSLQALRDVIGGTLDYSISGTPCRNEFIRFEGYDKEKLNSLDSQECPLTGVCFDVDVIEGIREDTPEKIINRAHSDYEYTYSSEYLKEFCTANEYEFKEDGVFYAG